jgi:hypothetical protein
MPAPTERSSNRLAVFILALFLLTSAVSCIWTIGRIKDAVVTAVLRGGLSPGHAALATLGPLDGILLAACAVFAFLIIQQEWRRQLFSVLLTSMSGAETFAVLTLIVVWTGQCYLYPGVLLGGDTATHISRLLEVSLGLQDGHLPQWTNYQYLGAPLLWFTGPLFYVVGGLVTFALGDPTRAAKAILLVLHVASAWFYYLLLTRIGFARLASLVAAVCYSSCFAILHLFLFRGVFPQAFTIVFLITLFYAADGLLRVRNRWWADSLIFSLSTAGLIVNHQPHALFAAMYLAIFGIVAVFTGFWTLRGVHRLLIAGILGVITSTVAVLPTIVEAEWVMITPGEQPISVQLPSLIRLSHLLLWHDTRTTWGYDYWAYLGLGLILGTVAGLYALARGQLAGPIAAVTKAATICLVFCFFLYNQVVRDILFLTFFAGLITASGMTWFGHVCRQRPRLLLGVCSLVILDILSTSVQPVARTDKGMLVQAGLDLHRIAPNQRVIQIFLEKDQPPAADMGPDNTADSYEAPLGRIAGNHNMAATHVHNYLLSIIDRVQDDLRANGHLGDKTSASLAMLNVTRIICNSPTANGCPASFTGAVEDPILGRYVPVADATPVIFSRHLVSYATNPDLEKPMLWEQDFNNQSEKSRITAIRGAIDTWVDTEHPDLATRQAVAIPVKALPDGYGDPGADHAWHPQLESYAVTVDTAQWRIRSDAAGYAQLAFPWYPAMMVTVNGIAETPIRGMLDLMVVRVPAGDVTIAVRPAMTPVERDSLLISALGLAATLAYSAWLLRRRTSRCVTDRPDA